MKLSQFNYDYTPGFIAQYPSELSPEQIEDYQNLNISNFRDDCRLMVLHKDTGEIEHKRFTDIVKYFGENDTFVFNDTKVFPARLYGNKEKTGAKIEVFLLRELNKDQKLWDVLVDPARKIRIGNKLYFGENDSLVAEVIDNTTSRGRTLRFSYDGEYEEFKKTLYEMGELPVPVWVRNRVEPIDTERFQTIYAAKEGAVATPAAGLHFSKSLFKRMEIKGIKDTYLTLHMGLGHFRTVDVEDLSKHKMDSEQMFISQETADLVNNTKASGNQVVAVGITVLRALETFVTTKGTIKEYSGWTNKFFFPPYVFTVPNALVTNFHLPQSTMLMATAAFGGYENVMNAYEVAIKEGYKFGTYGDAMLIL